MKKPLPVLISCFAVLFFLQFTAYIIYFDTHKNTIEKSYRDDILQEVMNIIHMVQATPEAQLPRAIQSLDNSRVSVNISEHAQTPLKVTDLTFWHINHLMKKHKNKIALSLALPDDKWVNVKVTFQKSSTIWPHFLILISELGIALVVIFYAWSVSRFTTPLKKFKKVAERLGISLEPTHLQEYKGPLVIQEMAQAMNTMQQRISDLINDRTMMLAAISHDLRTPITRMKLRTHMASDKSLTAQTLKDLDEMESMITELLNFSKNENDSEEKRKLCLNSFLQTICDDFVDVGKRVIYKSVGKRIAYPTRELMLKRALVNLIENALKYGEQATVSLRAHTKNITIIIEDLGPGIPEHELDKVFMPFYRCDGSRSRKIAGTGLGLAIAQNSIRAHGGEIKLANQTKGLKVTITLPV